MICYYVTFFLLDCYKERINLQIKITVIYCFGFRKVSHLGILMIYLLYCLTWYTDISPTGHFQSDTSPRTDPRLTLPRRRLPRPNISLLRHFRDRSFPRPDISVTICFSGILFQILFLFVCTSIN